MKYHIFLAIALLICLLLPSPALAANQAEILKLQTTRNCSSCDLTGAYLPVSNLDYTYLLAANLSHANLVGSSIIFSNLSRASLNGANLSYVNLRHTKMLLTDFTDVILDRTDFRDADLTSANISTDQLAKVKLCKTTLPNGLISNRDC
jgi:uncharacterized protein YjbI with pentapeptide repeats